MNIKILCRNISLRFSHCFAQDLLCDNIFGNVSVGNVSGGRFVQWWFIRVIYILGPLFSHYDFHNWSLKHLCKNYLQWFILFLITVENVSNVSVVTETYHMPFWKRLLFYSNFKSSIAGVALCFVIIVLQ